MEIFNEVVNILFIDLLFSFTDVIIKLDQNLTLSIRDAVGTFFIIMLLGTITVHISFLLGPQIKEMKGKCTKKYIRHKWRKTKRDARNGCGLREKPIIGPMINKICKKKQLDDDSVDDFDELKPRLEMAEQNADENSFPSTNAAPTPSTVL